MGAVMRKHAAESLALCAGLILCLPGSAESKQFNVKTSFKMEIIENGKPAKRYLDIHLGIFEDSGKMVVNWDHVIVQYMISDRRIIFRLKSFNSRHGEITDISVYKDSFSFRIKIDDQRTIHIMGNKADELSQNGYNVEGVGLWWNYDLNREIKVEWRQLYGSHLYL